LNEAWEHCKLGKYTFRIITFGCPVNQCESAALETAMLREGYVKTEGRARINIINSCVVTGSAAAEARRVARKIKREDPQALVVLAGCYPQVYHSDLARQLPEADIIIGTKGRADLPGIIRRRDWEKSKNPVVLVRDHAPGDAFEDMHFAPGYHRVRPVIKIQEGCNEYCTYCIIRKARGKSRSLPPARVLARVRELLEEGHREIILAGNQLGLYGQDLGDADLPAVVEEISRLPYDFRIRLGYVEPMNISERLLETVAANPKVCKHLYIPVQSCSDRVLKKMGRRYRAADFTSIVHRARSLSPGLSIWTDLIVGFPGEEEEDHVVTRELIRELAPAHLHVFPYSPRPGTPAACFSGAVRPDVKRRRVEEMRNLDRQLVHSYNLSMLGRELRVLVERVAADERGAAAEGYADNYVKVVIPLKGQGQGFNLAVGEFVRVKVDAVYSREVHGRVI